MRARRRITLLAHQNGLSIIVSVTQSTIALTVLQTCPAAFLRGHHPVPAINCLHFPAERFSKPHLSKMLFLFFIHTERLSFDFLWRSVHQTMHLASIPYLLLCRKHSKGRQKLEKGVCCREVSCSEQNSVSGHCCADLALPTENTPSQWTLSWNTSRQAPWSFLHSAPTWHVTVMLSKRHKCQQLPAAWLATH